RGELTTAPGMSAEDLKLLLSIERRLTAVEALLNEAHRAIDQRRDAIAISRADSAAALEAELLADIQTFSQTRAIHIEKTSTGLPAHTDERGNILIGVIFAAIVLGALIVWSTMRSIGAPLEQLVVHARALSEGRLHARTNGNMPGEFRELAI